MQEKEFKPRLFGARAFATLHVVFKKLSRVPGIYRYTTGVILRPEQNVQPQIGLPI